jgi:hypothetical protein
VTGPSLLAPRQPGQRFGGETRWLLASFEQEWSHDAVEAAKQSQDHRQAAMELGSSTASFLARRPASTEEAFIDAFHSVGARKLARYDGAGGKLCADSRSAV